MLNVSQPSHVGSDFNLGDIRPSAVVSDAVSSVDSVGDVDYGADSKVDPDFDPVAYINEPRWHTMSLGLDRHTRAVGTSRQSSGFFAFCACGRH